MEIFSNHFLDWIILIGIISAAIYTLKIIGKEGTTFKEDSYEVIFSNLSLKIPRWWTITQQNQTEIKFERTDTRYDWYAKYSYHQLDQKIELTKILENKLNQEEIEFDEDVTIETDSRVLFRIKETQEKFLEVLRVEGRASQKEHERIFYEIYIARKTNDNGYFMFESWSSVLNGAIEGPYFEESLSELNFFSEQSL